MPETPDSGSRGEASTIRAVVFDLDGTLVDTAAEMASALNAAFDELGLPPLDTRQVRDLIGRGVASLVQRALVLSGAAVRDVAEVVERFETRYAEKVGTVAQLYPGVEPAFELLRRHAVPIGVVTNKPRSFTERLLDRFDLRPQLSALVAGDDGLRKKPAPDMILSACRQLGTCAADTLVVGDSVNDVLAARATGCRVWCVPYGYNEGRPPESLECDRLVGTVLAAARQVVDRER